MTVVRYAVLIILVVLTSSTTSAETIGVTGFLEINFRLPSESSRGALHFTGPRFDWTDGFVPLMYTPLGSRRDYFVPVSAPPTFTPPVIPTSVGDDTFDSFLSSVLVVDGIERRVYGNGQIWSVTFRAEGPSLSPPTTGDFVELVYPMTLRLLLGGPLFCCPDSDFVGFDYTVPAIGRMQFTKALWGLPTHIVYEETLLRIDVVPEAVPEPASLVLLAGGLGLVRLRLKGERPR